MRPAAPAVPTPTAFPNPTTDRATLAWEAAAASLGRWYLTTSTGQVLRSEALDTQAGPNTLVLSLQPYPAGSYLLPVEAAGQAPRRVLVQRVN